MQIIEKAFAKVNISLNLTGQKEEDLHYIVSLVCFCDYHDTIVMEDSKEFKYHIVNDINFKQPDLVLKTIDSVSKEIGIKFPPFKITLNKQIPIGAGLGGGSADAAAVIRALDKFFNLNLSYEQKVLIGKKIGSDVPSCILSKPQIISGYGDYIRELKGLKDKNILIVYPNISISTKEIFESIDINLIKKKESKVFEKLIEQNINLYNEGKNLSKLFSNDLEEFAINKYPIIKEIRDCLNKYYPSYVSMTGSGSAFFGVFEENLIDNAYNKIKNDYKDWKVIKCKLIGSDNREIN